MRFTPLSVLSVTAALTLSACVGAPFTGPAQVQEAKLSNQVLTLVLSNGTVCRANWVQMPVGRIEQCGAGFGYAVKPVQNPNFLRKIWTDLSQSLGGDGIAAPMAEVVVTDSAGIDHVFISPPPIENIYD